MPVTANNKPAAGEVNAAAVENGSEATATVDVGKDVEVVVNTLLRGQLDEMMQILKQRETLLASLPPELREAVQQALQQGGTTPEQLPDGTAAWLQNGKKAADQLMQLTQLLEQAVVLKQPGQELAQAALQQLLAQAKAAGQGGTAEVLAQLQQLIKASGEAQQWQTGLERVLVPQHLADTLPDLPPDLAKMLTKVFDQYKPQLTQLWQQGGSTAGVPVMAGQTDGPAPALPATPPANGAAATGAAANPEQAPAGAKQPAAMISTWTAPKLVLLQQAAQTLSLIKVPQAELQAAAQQLRQAAAALNGGVENGKAVTAQTGTLPAAGTPPTAQTVGETYAAARDKLSPVLQAVLPSALTVSTMPPSNLAEQLRQTADQFLFAAYWQQQDRGNAVAPELQKLAGQISAQPQPGLQALPQEATALLQRLLQGQTTNQQLGNLVRQLAASLQQSIDSLPPEQRQAFEQLVNTQMAKVPPQVAETAVRQQLPELPKVWAAMRALAAQPLTAVPENLKPQALDAVKELAQTLYKPAALQTEKLPDHSTVAFSMPLYVGDGQYYPAHIHLYYQHQQQGGGGAARQNRYETWLRISLETKHVGTVDTVFRVYDEDKVDVRVGFSDSEAMQEFGQGVADLRKDLSDNRLQLQDVSLHRVRT